MAKKKQHIAQWKHNRDFLQSISPDFPDWLVTASFYVALHAVDTLFAHDGVRSVDHQSRNKILMTTNRYQKINDHYHPLYGLCRTIRYMANPKEWVPADQIELEVIKGFVYPIENSVQKLIGEDFQWGPIQIATLPAEKSDAEDAA